LYNKIYKLNSISHTLVQRFSLYVIRGFFLAFCPKIVEIETIAGKWNKSKLRIDGMYYTTKVYTPDGKRTLLSFGYVDDRPDSEVHAIFAKWVEFYEQHP
jgi:hypothetical protein